MTTHHSPAPWTTDGKAETDTLDIVSPLGRIAMLDCSHDLVLEDARLIAAAPDLLAALQAIVNEAGSRMGLDDTPGSINTMSRIARAAINKATGEQT